MRVLLSVCLLLNCLILFSQRKITGVIADSLTKQVLPFATIRAVDSKNTYITGLNGKFTIDLAENTTQLLISYISYESRVIPVKTLRDADTIFLTPATALLGEVILKPQSEKIRYIINSAIRNKPIHNPELYPVYQCRIYYKMKVDLHVSRIPGDSVKDLFSGNNHLLMSETYSKRIYKHPGQLQEIVLASRFSGLRQTYFTNLVTDVLPFHIYSDYITLNNKDYINPIARGWQNRYDFRLADEIYDGEDTIYILTFKPKMNLNFNSLEGMVYIQNNSFAVSHFISTTTDTLSGREIRLEQVYHKSEGKWFPRELNYEMLLKNSMAGGFIIKMNGHSYIDSVTYQLDQGFKFDKGYTVKLDDSVDSRSSEDWEKMRQDSLTLRENNTYRIIDSISQRNDVEEKIVMFGELSRGFFPFKKINLDIARLYTHNDFEGHRVGIGLYTNDKWSKHYSIGGWFGYGFKDKVMKFGGSAQFFHRSNKDNWLKIYYNNDYQNTGNIQIHREIDRSGYRNWLLSRIDHVRTYGITAHTQRGFWEIELNGSRKDLESLYQNNFIYGGKNYTNFNVTDGAISLRFAYGEKRTPVFGYYMPVFTKHPVLYFRASTGLINSNEYSANYIQAFAAVTYKKHFNRWGNDNFQLEAGAIHALNDKPLARSFLLAAKGFRTDGLNFYSWGGFLTMRPYDYFSDKYASLLYKHDFDRYLWKHKFSKPFISLAYNVMFGGLELQHQSANGGISTLVSGYHEPGIIVNQLLQKNLFQVSYIYLNVGAFYHVVPELNWKKHGVLALGISLGF